MLLEFTLYDDGFQVRESRYVHINPVHVVSVVEDSTRASRTCFLIPTNRARWEMPRKKTCTCLKEVMKQLESTNTELDLAFIIDFKTGKYTGGLPQLAVMKRDTKKREPARHVVCSFCPFCGTKYEGGGQGELFTTEDRDGQ